MVADTHPINKAKNQGLNNSRNSFSAL